MREKASTPLKAAQLRLGVFSVVAKPGSPVHDLPHRMAQRLRGISRPIEHLRIGSLNFEEGPIRSAGAGGLPAIEKDWPYVSLAELNLLMAACPNRRLASGGNRRGAKRVER